MTVLREVPGFLGYQVNDKGQVFSNWVWVRYGTRSNGCRKRTLGSSWSLLKGYYDSAGYHMVGVFVNKKSVKIRTHTLVLLAFQGPRPDGYEACHNDGNPANNYASNLRWGDHQSNVLDRDKHGTHNKGERNGQRKLSEQDVLDIRDKHSKGIPQTVLAKEYGMFIGTIYSIIHRLRWKHI